MTNVKQKKRHFIFALLFSEMEPMELLFHNCRVVIHLWQFLLVFSVSDRLQFLDLASEQVIFFYECMKF